MLICDSYDNDVISRVAYIVLSLLTSQWRETTPLLCLPIKKKVEFKWMYIRKDHFNSTTIFENTWFVCCITISLLLWWNQNLLIGLAFIYYLGACDRFKKIKLPSPPPQVFIYIIVSPLCGGFTWPSCVKK